MFKVTDSGQYHSYTVFVTILESQIVSYRTARLDNSLDTFLVRNFHTVWEREECITSHNSTIQVEVERLSLFNRLFQGIYTASLTHATGNQLLATCQNDSVALAVLYILLAKSMSSTS